MRSIPISSRHCYLPKVGAPALTGFAVALPISLALWAIIITVLF